MMDLICSKDIREYVEKIGYEFSDFEKAVLISHNGQSLTKKNQALLELERSTTDEALKRAIQTQVNHDNKCIQEIKKSASDEFYMVEASYKDEKNDEQIREYFVSFEEAFNCVSESKRDFTISKIKLHRGKTQWDEDHFNDGVVAYIIYSECEPVLYYAQGDTGAEYDDDEENFEYIEIPIPHPFKPGDMIRLVGTEDYGIVVELGEGCESEIDGVGKVNKQESITVELVNENALFTHFHVLPSKLEYANLPKGNPLRELLQEAAYMSQGRCYIQGFQMACEKYLELMK